MKPYQVLVGDCLQTLRTLPKQTVQCCICSPPYFNQRDYQTGVWEGGDPACKHLVRQNRKVESSTLSGGKKTVGHVQEGFSDVCKRCGAKRVDNQIGQESTPEAYIDNLVKVFRAVRRVLRDDGVLFLNLGDTYAGSGRGQTVNGSDDPKVRKTKGMRLRRVQSALPSKNLMGIPWRTALALQADGWILRSEMIWHKRSPMPESVSDRPSRSHEHVFMLVKQPKYFYDAEACKEPTGANRRTVISVSTEPLKMAHFAAYPIKLILPMILAGTSEKGCCPRCRAPYRRLVEKVRQATRPALNGKVVKQRKIDAAKERLGQIVGNRDPERHMTQTKTVGWEPTCGCDAGEPIPCVVLDPFAGSGSSLVAAVRRNRHAIGCELNPEYVKIIHKRVGKALRKRGFGLV